MSNPEVRRSYSALADLYIEVCGALDLVDPEDLAFLERNLGCCEGVVLDAGCGPGHLTAYLTDLGLTARGIDLVPEFIDHARSNRPDIDFQVGSMIPLDVRDASLGGILSWYSTIHHEPAVLAGVFAEFRRAMSPGGTIVVGFFEADEVGPFDHKVTTAYRWPVNEMSQLLSSAGFVEIDRAQRPGKDQVRSHAALAARAE